MKNYRAFNHNKMVKVKLTEFGIEILKRKLAKVFGRPLTDEDLHGRYIREDGFYYNQFWLIIDMFGEYFGNNDSPIIEDGYFFFCEDDLIPENELEINPKESGYCFGIVG